jgi:ketosteroid isomerase-like protein
MRQSMILVLCMITICVNACRRTTHPPAQTEKQKYIANVNAILRLKRTKMEAWSNRNADVVTDLYEEDAFVLEDGKSLHGIDEIKKQIRTSPTGNKVDHAINSGTGTAYVARSGDIGYSHDIIESTSNDPKTNKAKRSEYVTVYRKRGNQPWKIVTDVWTSDSLARQ